MANMLPATFFGHGNPMNAVTINGHTQRETPRAKAILPISAHWFVLGTGVTICRRQDH